jgi:hypothetical protein
MEKYLRHYAEPEVIALADMLAVLPEQQPWESVVVIPACNETDELLRPPPPCDGRSLLILIINESTTVSEKVTARNHALERSVENKFKLLWKSENHVEFELSLFQDQQLARDVLLVDRFSTGRQLPVKGGVGHARKIGGDLAASLIHSKLIKSPWIHCTDGDVCLPKTYFAANHVTPDDAADISALVYPYRHRDDQEQSASQQVILATQLYELSLRYYVAGMKYANSPYAFHTIGSTIVVNASHYAKVRGFPKRAAGEDFYLLNKLAKVGTVRDLSIAGNCEAIQIEARKSDRVPFGTGAAVIKITDLINPVADFSFYNPAIFELLKLWLQSLPAHWASGSPELRNLPEPVSAALKSIKTERALVHAFNQSNDLHQFTRQMHTWFDAFRTLKFIHSLRDHCLPSISYAEIEVNRIFQELLIIDQGLSDFNKQLGERLQKP